MSTSSSRNSLARTISLLLDLVIDDKSRPAVFDYSCADDFRRLWSFQHLGVKQIIIVWSRTAIDSDLSPINAADCLSPVDWAMCCAAQETANPGDWPAVLILDLDPSLHGSVASVAHLNALKPDQFPWLRVDSDVQLPSIINWLATSPAWDGERGKVALQRFLRMVRLTLTEARPDGTYDRHAISNLIGPMVLRGQEANKTLHSAALLSLLKACGLVPPPGQGTDAAPEVLPTETGEALGVLLVDDQAGHGWEAWVRESLPDAELAVLKDPTTLTMRVQEQLAAAKTKDLRFRLSLPKLASDKTPVLLLDLRLFSGDSSKELRFYKNRMLPLIRAHFLDRNDLAWPSFSSQDQTFTNAASAVEDGSLFLKSSENERRETLTWLPRLLSLADMSLPIVLFSSTGRRELVERFRDYGNIITAFEKPRWVEVHGATTSGEAARRCVADLHSVLSVARLQAAPRVFTSHVMDTACNNRPHAFGGTDSSPTSTSDWNVSVHIDESGSEGSLRLGALVAVFPGAKSEWDIDKAISQFHSEAHEDKEYCRKLDRLTAMLAIARTEGASLGYLELIPGGTMVYASKDTADDFHDEWREDNLWRQMFVRLIECSIFGVARWLMPEGGQLSGLSVRAPTRHLPLNDGLKNPKSTKRRTEREKELWKHWGIQVITPKEGGKTELRPPRPLFRFFGCSDARPLVEGVLQLYRHTGLVPKCQVARAFALNTHGQRMSHETTLLHFATDGLVSVGKTPEWVRNWKVDYELGLELLLRANRHMLNNDTVEAVLALNVARTLVKDKSSFFMRLEADVAAQLQTLTGNDFLRLGRDWQVAPVDVGTVDRLKGYIVGELGANGRHKRIRGVNRRVYCALDCAVSIKGQLISFRRSRRVSHLDQLVLVEDVRLERTDDAADDPR